MQQALRTHIRSHVAAAALLLVPGAVLLATQPAAAQERVARPAIASLTVDADRGLAPGSTLRLVAHATPGARWATVSLGEGGPRVALREQGRGRYTGTYVVRRGDRIDPRVAMVARFDHAGLVTSRDFRYPPNFVAVAPLPAIERFAVRNAGRLEPGRELRFRVVGSVDGKAWVDIPGVERGIALREERPGVYEGSYTVRRRDDTAAFARAVATLQTGQQRVTARAEFRDRFDRDDRFGFDDPRLPLEVTSHADNGLTDAHGRVFLQGRTAPGATVRIQMNTVAELAGLVGVTQPVADLTVRADGRGDFGVQVQPRFAAIPGARYEVVLTATSGRDVAEERLTLRARG